MRPKLLFSIGALLFLVGCTTLHKSHHDLDCAQIRSVASNLQCAALFSKLKSSSHKENPQFKSSLRKFIHDDVPHWFVQFENQFGRIPNSEQYLNEWTSHRKRVAADLYQRKNFKGQATEVFTEIGYGVRDVGGGVPGMVPVKSYMEIWQQIYVLMLSRSKFADPVSDPNMILPALVLQRAAYKKVTQFGETRTVLSPDYLLIRPGLDPLPPVHEGWQLPQKSPQLPDAFFERALMDGKFPFEFMMIHHDSNHIVDFLSDESFMEHVRDYFRQKSKGDKSQNLTGRFKTLEMFFLEFNYKTKLNNGELIDQLFGSPTETLSKVSLRSKTSGLHQAELAAQAQQILESFFALYEVRGGGAGDGSHELNITYDIYESALRVLTGQKKPFMNSHFSYVHDDHYGMVHTLKELTRLRAKLDSATYDELNKIMSDLRYRGLNMNVQQLKIELENKSKDLIASTEYALRLGSTLRLTPTQIILDIHNLLATGDLDQYRKSATYRYYAQTATVGSAQWFAFVEFAQ